MQEKKGLGPMENGWRWVGDWRGDGSPADWEVAKLVLARWVRGWRRESFRCGGTRIIEVYAGV
jgi:hypothetical protein